MYNIQETRYRNTFLQEAFNAVKASLRQNVNNWMNIYTEKVIANLFECWTNYI